VVNDSADVTSSGRSFQVCGPVRILDHGHKVVHNLIMKDHKECSKLMTKPF